MTTPLDLHDRVALVAGGASGIGAAVCARLARAGARVYAADRAFAGESREGLRDPSIHPIPLDVCDEGAWERVMQTITGQAGQLDIVVNSAGVSGAGSVAETSLAEWRRIVGINLDGAFLATKHAIGAMREHGGCIVHIGSASGARPAPGAAAYSTSKGALVVLARVAAKECRAAGWPIRINLVSPAGVKTPMWRSMPFFQAMVAEHGSEEAAYAALSAGGGGTFRTPEEVAEVVAFLASPGASAITGAEIPVDDGYIL